RHSSPRRPDCARPSPWAPRSPSWPGCSRSSCGATRPPRTRRSRARSSRRSRTRWCRLTEAAAGHRPAFTRRGAPSRLEAGPRRVVKSGPMALVGLLLGGALGTVARYLVGLASHALFAGAYPVGTLVVNVLG